MIEPIVLTLKLAAIGIGGVIVALLGAYALGIVVAMFVCGYKRTLRRY